MRLLDQDMLEAFRKECVGALGIESEEANTMPNEQLLTLFYAYYHYFQGNPDCASQLLDGGRLYDENATHCITGVFRAAEDDNAEPGTLDVLVALWVDEQVKDNETGRKLRNIHQNCESFLEELRGELSGKLGKVEKRLKNLGFKSYGNDEHPIRIRFLLSAIPTKKQRETLGKRAGNKVSLDDDVLFGDDIEYEVLNTNSKYDRVHKATLLLDKPDNACRYGNALMVNVRASSLRRLYQTYRYRGLLSQNLRYFVKMPRVDNAMCVTISNMPEDFWYFNNGIIIVCKSCVLDGDRLELDSFSIINGGQTTHNIGEMDEEDIKASLMVPCKVIPMKPGMKEGEQIDFIAEISEASNTQKPIKAIDAVANRREQRELKRYLAQDEACSISYQTKRGEIINKKLKDWQRINSGIYAQCLLTFFYQYPGIARSDKNGLFFDDKLYNQLFSKPFLPVRAVRDLNILFLAATDFTKKSFKQSVSRTDVEGTLRKGLAKNGLFQLMACVGVLAKALGRRAFSGEEAFVLNEETVGSATPAYSFLNPNATTDELKKLLDYCLDTFIRPGYEEYLIEYGEGNPPSNFTKSNRYYRVYVLPKILQKVEQGFSSKEEECIVAALRSPSCVEEKEIRAFSEGHSQLWSPGDSGKNDVLFQSLLEFVDGLPKVKKVKKPNKTALKKIVNRNLRTPAALSKDAELDNEQIKHYGQAIIEYLRKTDAAQSNDA